MVSIFQNLIYGGMKRRRQGNGVLEIFMKTPLFRESLYHVFLGKMVKKDILPESSNPTIVFQGTLPSFWSRLSVSREIFFKRN